MRATSCLPVPVSPAINTTGTSLRAMSAASATSLFIASDAKVHVAASARPSPAGQVLHPVFERARVQRVADRGQDLLQLERLLDEVVRAELHRVDGVGDRSLRRDDEELRIGGVGAHLAQQIEPAAIAEHEVEDHRVGTHGLEFAQPLRARAGQRDLVALTRQRAAQRLPDQRFVVDNEDLRVHRVTSPAAA